MKPLTIAGAVLVVLGVFMLARRMEFGWPRNVVSVGDVHVSANEEHVIPAWVGGGAIVGGVLLLGAGLRRRRNT